MPETTHEIDDDDSEDDIMSPVLCFGFFFFLFLFDLWLHWDMCFSFKKQKKSPFVGFVICWCACLLYFWLLAFANVVLK